ncbi:MAG: BrxA/BrxB family bacilliredoxin [Ignavibacteria bacterium]|nr:BrxA/BrxB family bacilliredoxin [Ignavibacteria bacterium]
MYPETRVQPMRKEVADLGFEEIKTAQEIDSLIASTDGTLFFFINSVCGCSAGSARPALRIAMKNNILPEKKITVFAGNDVEATEQVRKYLVGFAPTSPSMWLLQNRKVVYAIERHHFQTNPPETIAEQLKSAFDRFCKVMA